MEPQDGRTSGSTTGQAPPQAQAHRDVSPRPSAPASESPVFASAIPVSGSHQHHQQPQPQQAGGPPTPAAVGNLPAIPSDPSAKEQQAAAKQSLKQWWTKFTKQQQQQQSGYPKKDGTSPTSSGKGVFGVPLTESLKYAGVAISMVGPDGINQVYGYIPIVVAKCGLFLKQKATTVEGVFRISGSTRRMKELQDIFDKPPSYGRDVVWGPWSVHDAASVLRRYLNQMPEPVVPYELYDEFRNALRKTQPTIERDEMTDIAFIAPIDKVKDAAAINASILRYKALIACLPSSSKYLLCYVLDLLNVFSRHHTQNLMPAANLAVVFQPGLIRPPDAPLHKPNPPLGASETAGGQSSEEALVPPHLPHLSRVSSNPLTSRPMTTSSTNDSKTNSTELRRQQDEIKINQEVLEFLINHQDHFVALPDFSSPSSSETSPVSPASGSGQTRGSAFKPALAKSQQAPAVRPAQTRPTVSTPPVRSESPRVPQNQPSRPSESPRIAQPIPSSQPPVAYSAQPRPPRPTQEAQSSRSAESSQPRLPGPMPAAAPQRETQLHLKEVPKPTSPTPFHGQGQSVPGFSSPMLQGNTTAPQQQGQGPVQHQAGRSSPILVLGQSQKAPAKASSKPKDPEKQKDDRKPRKLKKGRTPTGSGTSTPLSPSATAGDFTEQNLPPKQYSYQQSPYHSSSTPPAVVYDDDTPLARGMDSGPGVKRSRTLPSPGEKGSAVRRVSGRRGSDSRAIPSPAVLESRLSPEGRPTTAPSPLRSPIPRGAYSPLALPSPSYLGTTTADRDGEQSDSSDAQAGPSDRRKGAGWRRAFKKDKEREHSSLQVPSAPVAQSTYSGTSSPLLDDIGRRGSHQDTVSMVTRRPSTSSAARTEVSDASGQTQLRAVRNPPLQGHGKEGSGSMSKRDARKAAQQTPEFSPDAIRNAVTNIGR